MQDAGHHFAHPADAHNPHRFAVQVEANQLVLGKVVGANLRIGLPQVAAQGQNKGDGVLGRGMGGEIGHVGDPQAQPVGRG